MIKVLNLEIADNRKPHQAGNRVPALYQAPKYTYKLHIANFLNNNWNVYFETPSPSEDWVKLLMKQELTDVRAQTYVYSVFVNDKKVYFKTNTTPKVWTNVEAIFGQDTEYPLASGSYRKLRVTSKKMSN